MVAVGAGETVISAASRGGLDGMPEGVKLGWGVMVGAGVSVLEGVGVGLRGRIMFWCI